jgi:general secretion pathway protein B
MSYILDALRRADAERERGAVPGLSSQQHAYVEDDASRPQRPRALVWAIVALAAALIVAVAWNFIGGSQPTPRPVVEGSVSPAPAPTAPVPLPSTPSPAVATPAAEATTATSPTPGAPAQAALPTPTSVEPTQAATPVPAQRAAAKHPPEAKRVARRSIEPEPAPSANEHPSTAKVAEPKTAGGQGEVRVYQQSELPDDVRRDLPKLTIGGASYSGDAASRMVMINGQIFHEGDQLAPQLVLERIKLKSAVLSYKGYRYEVTF